MDNLFKEVGSRVGLFGFQEIIFILQGKRKDQNLVIQRQNKEAYNEMQAFLKKAMEREMRENRPPYKLGLELVVERLTNPEEENLQDRNDYTCS